MVVPVTSMLLPKLAPALNNALPESDISKVRAVIAEPPSLPLNTISWSTPSGFIKKLPPLKPNAPKVTPPSLSTIKPPSASRLMLVTASSVRSPVLAIVPTFAVPVTSIPVDFTTKGVVSRADEFETLKLMF